MNQVTKSYEIVAADAAAAATASATVLTRIGSTSDAAIKGYRISQVFAEQAFVVPTVGNVEEQAMLIFRLVGNPFKKATITIPAPKDTLFVATSGPDYNKLDLADASVISYSSMYLAGGPVHLSDGEYASQLESGRRIHRASSKG